MSGYTSGNNAPTLMAQAPNRKGNVSKHLPSKNTGVTAVTRPQGDTSYSGPNQGAAKATGNVASRNQPVSVKRPSEYYCGTIKNDGYMNSDRNNFLK